MLLYECLLACPSWTVDNDLSYEGSAYFSETTVPSCSPKRRHQAAWCQNPIEHSLNSPCGGNQETHSSCCYHRLRHRWDLNSLRWCQLMVFRVSQLIIISASCYQSLASCWSQCFLYISSKAMNVRNCGDCVCCFLEVSYPSLLQRVLYLSLKPVTILYVVTVSFMRLPVC